MPGGEDSRTDDGPNAERASSDVGIHILTDLELLPGHLIRQSTKAFDDLQTPANIPQRIRIRLSLLQHDAFREIGEVVFDQVLVLEEDLLAVEERGAGPGFECLGGGLGCAFEFFGR